jgi:hypothetical protein
MRKGTITAYTGGTGGSAGVGIVTFDNGSTTRIHSSGTPDELHLGDRVAVEGNDFPPRVYRLNEPRREVAAVAAPEARAVATDPRSDLQRAVDDLIDGKEGDYES